MVELDNISYNYNGKAILSNISCNIDENEIISIIGPNGSGKTTLLKIINNLINPTSGNIFIEGKKINSLPNKELAKLVSYVPQAHTTLSIDMTVFDFVSMGRYPHLNYLSQLSKEDIEYIKYVMEIVNISHMADKQISRISGGERQKVYIASALAQKSKLMLLDEPTSFLDPKTTYDINNLILKLNKSENITFIIVSHNLDFIVDNSSKILALKNGSLFSFSTPQNIIKEKLFNSLYDIDFEYIFYSGKYLVKVK